MNQLNEVIGNFSLRVMTEADLTLIWKWRNHPSIRAVSNCQDLVPWADHLGWFRDSSGGLKLVFTDHSRTIGVVTKNRRGYWSFYLDPELSKGSGYGLIMLSLAIAYLKQTGTKEIKAQVLESNQASLKLHKQVGFSVLNKTKKVYELLYCAGHIPSQS